MVVVPNWSSCPFTPKYLIKQVRNGLLHTAADMHAASILRSWIFGYAFLGGDPRIFCFQLVFKKCGKQPLKFGNGRFHFTGEKKIK